VIWNLEIADPEWVRVRYGSGQGSCEILIGFSAFAGVWVRSARNIFLFEVKLTVMHLRNSELQLMEH